MTRKITENITRNINAKITFKRVNIGLFKSVSFRELYIEDQQEDTLLFSEYLKINLKSFSRSKRKIDFRRIELYDAGINFKTDSTNTINLKFITDRLKRKDTTLARMRIKIPLIKCRNTRFSYTKNNYQTNHKGINLKDIQLSNLNFDVKNLQTHHDSIDIIVENLKCREKSGFKISNLDFQMHISPRYLNFNEIRFESPQSNLIAKKVELIFNGYKKLKDFTNNVKLNININNSSLSSQDLSFFASSIDKIIPERINLTGKLTGYIPNFKGKQIEVDWGKNTHVYCDFALNGLPDINKTFMFIDIDSLQTTIQDIKNISAQNNGKSLSFPDQLKKLGKITYTGNFTGFIDDFVTYGEFNSDLGIISTDLTIKPDTMGLVRFSGEMKTNNFNLGKLFYDTCRVGNISMDIRVNGYSAEKMYKATLKGNIDDLFINKYHYKNINLSGKFTPKAYDGSIYIKDPNIELNFLGSLDFSGEIPEFDFTANVPKVNLYDLFIEPEDTNSFLSFLLTANFAGRNIDNLEGKINLINSTYRKMGEELHVFDFSLSALNRNGTNQLILKTDFVDALIAGNYNFNQLGTSYKHLTNNILPSLTLTEPDTIRKSDNHFEYSILLKNTKKLSKFLFPSFAVSPNSTFEGKFYPNDNYFLVKGEAERFSYKGNELQNMLLNAECSDSLFSLNLTGEKLAMKNKTGLKGFSIVGNSGNDTANFNLSWAEQTKHNLRSQIKIIADLKNEQKQSPPLITISFLPTNLYIKDSIWKINPGIITIDTTSIRVTDFSINNKEQWLKVHGGISEQQEDTLLIQFKGLNLSSLNTFAKGEKIKLNGIINGNANLSNLYNNPLFQTNININDLLINNEPLGFTSITSAWDTINEQLDLEISADRGKLRTLNMKGNYEPESKEINFSFNLNKLRLNIFKPFINKISTELNGIATGNIIIDGTLLQPTANGTIKLQKTSFLIDFFNTRYSFTDQIEVNNNTIKFEDINIFDPEGNQAIISGDIKNNYFKDFVIDLRIDARNILLMNTGEIHNNQFYGSAFGSGIVNISGPPKDLNINVSLKTEENTRFFLPLSTGEELEDFNFVSFVDNQSQTDIEKKDVTTEKNNMPKINLDLEITPVAEAQLIFNPNTGDNIKGRGSGNLNLQINNQRELNIFGTYTIEQGEYLFSLQNIINKKFKVSNGGTITWNGNPLDADMDIEAVYETKASLYELFLSEEYRRRIPIECQLYLTEKIQNPKIDFGIELPTADQETRTNLQNAINTQEELSKQFLSLIVINSFLPNTNYIPPTSQSITSNYVPAVGVTTSELLSNQLSNWLSQISNDFDIGFRYRPGDEISSDEVEVALSTQLLNDRVSINGNVDVGGNETSTNTSNIVGDFTVDVKINKSGKLRVKAFTRANDKLLYEWSPYTQGVGLFYREEFDHFDQLMQRYWNKIFGRKSKNEK